MSDNEKHSLDRTETNTTEKTSSGEYLEKQQTLQQVDLENHQAFKGDDSDGKVEWTAKKLCAAACLAMLYTGSQIPLYFAGATLSFIAKDIGAASAIGWLPVANTLAIAAICPFVGYMQDLFGKRYIALLGALLLCTGVAVLGTAHGLPQALAGMAMSGAGAGIGELTGLAGLAETVPVRQRGYSLAVLTAFVLPWCPYVLYAELFSTHATWRWGPWISLIFNGITGIGLLFTYFPHAHVRAEGLPWQAVLKRIDFIGGGLSILGLVLFLVALQAGGYSHSWSSAYVLCTLLIGLALIGCWILWEAKFARHPMIPPELFKGQRVVALGYAVAFVAGMNFFSLLNFWPLTISAVYSPQPVKIGLRGMPVGLSTAAGAIFWNALLSTFPGGARWILVCAACVLTAFGGSLASMTPDNVVSTVAVATIAAFGLGGVLVPAATIAMIAAPDALITTCAALSLSVRAVGGAIGYSIYYNIFSGKLKKKLPVLVAEYAIKAGLPLAQATIFVETYLTAPANIMSVKGVTEEVLAGALKGSQWAYAESLHYVWYTSIAFGIMAIIAAAALPNTARFSTNRIAVAL
ncbi:hypothetical protein LTR62_002736 [Meristemomyces frigidus]|uniref:Major facilitator superfamily (MFS) profile domain-containing protein n=1 Tax=Meristemomyces frigidus TaxID=1508187 RepID=A0AAN7TFX4_9PEZI|nr:hypothetical protein LTR62_002736 [Meristemomyces frigidus]